MENTNINPDNPNCSNQPLQNQRSPKTKASTQIAAAAFPRHTIKTVAFDKIAMIADFVLTFLFIQSVTLASDSSWKVTASYLGIFILATAFIAVKQKTINAQTIVTGALCVASSMSFALRENPAEIQMWVIIMLIYLSGSYCIALTNSNRHGRNSYFFLLDVAKTEVLLPLKHMFLPYAAMIETKNAKRREKGKEGKKLDKKYLAAIIGIICAIPVLLIVIPLLLKSDAAFESVTGSFFENIRLFFVSFDDRFKKFSAWFGENVFCVIPTILVAPYIFSVMFSFRHSVANEENKDTSKNYAKLRFGSPALFSGFLGVICLVYAVYILSQTAYFFSAFGGKLPNGTNITISEYARRGFFELAGVAAVNLVLIAVTVLFSRRNGKKFSMVIKAFDLFLCAFNILLSAVSMSKIILYMNEMGLTHKRIYVFLIDTVMIVTFFCIAARLFNEKFPYMRIITATACVLLTALSLVGIDGIIANYNTEKYLNDEIECADTCELFDGDEIGSFESLIKIAESKTALKSDAEEKLTNCYKWFSCGSGKNFKLYDSNYIFNIDARKALNAVNNHIFTVKNQKPSYEIYVSVDSLIPIKSIGITVYSDGGKGSASVFENADGSPLESDRLYMLSDKYIPDENGCNSIDFETTDQNGNRYIGTVLNQRIENGDWIKLYDMDNELYISYDGDDSIVYRLSLSPID